MRGGGLTEFDPEGMGARLRLVRDEAHLTQDQIAEWLGTTKGNVSHWETAKHAPPYEALTKFAFRFQRSLNWLIVGMEASEALMTKEEYEFARKLSDLPPALKAFVYLGAELAMEATERLPDSVLRAPTRENWLDFAQVLFRDKK